MSIEPIFIVSGLPRSGTSLLMQMLSAGGLSTVTDSQRLPDADNPLGYFEDSRVKSLSVDNSWLDETHGKAIKVVSHLLIHLKPRLQYKIIFMERNMNEIIASQNKMLAGKNLFSSDGQNALIEKKFLDHVKQISELINNSSNMDALFVNYNDLIMDPKIIVHNIIQFTNRSLDYSQMIQVINNKLYRNRYSSSLKT